MSDTSFTGQVTAVPADWANDVNDLVYDVFNAAKTAAAARAALGLGSLATQNANAVNVLGGVANNLVLGNLSPAEATFSRVVLATPGSSEEDVLNRTVTRDLADSRAALLINTLLTTKGDLLVRGADPVRQPVGGNSQVLVGNSASATGMSWATFTMLAEKNPLDDTGNRGDAGDLLARTDTEYTRLPVGSDGQVLVADSSLPQKMRWGSISGGGGAALEQDVDVIGTDVGAVPDGDTFPEGMTFTEFVLAISQKVIPPSFGGPQLTLIGSPPPGNFEVGELLDLTFTENYVQNDAGARVSLILSRNAVVASTIMPYSETGVQMTLVAGNYWEEVTYDEGPCKLDNFGQEDCTGRIPAGTVVSNTLSYIGQRKAFYGTPVTTPTDSAGVRAVGNSVFAAYENSGVSAAGLDLVGSPSANFTITIPIGATRVVFAYPATLRAVASVRYQELANSEVKGNFTETLVNVQGANGFAAASYRVYTYVPVEPFSIVNNYRVFI